MILKCFIPLTPQRFAKKTARRHDFLSVYVYFNVTEHPRIRLVLIISRFLTDVPGTNLLHNVKRRHFGKFRIYTLWDVAL